MSHDKYRATERSNGKPIEPLSSDRWRRGLEAVFYRVAEVQFKALRLLIRGCTRPKQFELTLRNCLKRPEWVYIGGLDLDPIGRFTIREARPGNDRLLCERLIAAYQRTASTSPVPVSSIWSTVMHRHYRGLHAALEGQNPDQLATLLAGMFQQSFLYGIASCAPGLRMRSFIRMKSTEELLGLAEALGLVRTETPEQGILGHELARGLEAVVKKIEEHLGMSMDFPQVGGAYGIEVGGHLITPEAPEHIYVAHRIREAMRFHLPPSAPIKVLEIGAGFGGTAHWLKRLQPITDYTIVDLPLMNVCQGYFLAKAFGESTVQLFGEPGGGSDINIHILPAHAKEQAGDFNLLLNENSMPEIPEAAVQDYVSWARGRKPKLFYSYNQEGFSPGFDQVPQTLVPEIVARVGGFKRLSRNYSWLRPGYVEEIYALVNN